MKKAVVFFLSCTLLASMLAGCGSENGQKNTENGKVEKENVEENKVEGKLTVAVTEDRVKYYEPVLFTNALTSSTYQSTYEMGVFLQSIGGSLYEIDNSGKPVATIDTPEMKKYLEFVQELKTYMPEDSITMEGTEQRNQFCNGNIGMMESGPWEYGEIDMESLDL